MERQADTIDTDAARAALDDVRRARRAPAIVPTPGWYWPCLAVLVAAIFLSELGPSGVTVGVTLAVAIGIGVMISVYQQQVGVRARMDWRPALATALLLLCIGGAAVLADQLAGWTWAWAVAAAVGAGAILLIGRRLDAHTAACRDEAAAPRP